jgi:hypothetical protein
MFGMPARFKDTYESALPPHGTRRVIVQTFEELGWPFSETESGAMSAILGANMSSWGEVVTVEVMHDGLIAVESACRVPFQVFDWGKNRQNVREFICRLQQNEIRYSSVDPGSEDDEFEKDASSRVDKLFHESEG